MSDFRRRLMMSIKKSKSYEGYFDDEKAGYINNQFIMSTGELHGSVNFAIYFIEIPETAKTVELTNTAMYGASNTFLGVCSGFNEETMEISNLNVIRNTYFSEKTISLDNIDKYLVISIKKANSAGAYFKFT
ncbi:MAG: hypothetical protein ACI4W1_07175 [Ruminococcus sp.]